MNKTLALSYLYFSLIALTGCTSDMDRNANDYASKAFDALVDKAENNIDVGNVKWICWEHLYYQRGLELGCLYYIRFKYEGYDLQRFAEVSIEESSGNIYTTAETYGAGKMLDQKYNDALESKIAQETKKNGGRLLPIALKTGVLSRRNIKSALNKLETDTTTKPREGFRR